MLLDFQHSEVLKLLSLSQATHSLLSPCDSRKSCFTAKFALNSCCHLFGLFSPSFSMLSKINAKLCRHLQLPMSLHLTLPPTTPVLQLPPSPSHCTHSCSDRFWVLPPPPCGQVPSSLYFLELQLHKESARTVFASTQTTSSTAAQLQPAGSGSFQHLNTREETVEILTAQRWLQSCVQVQRQGNCMLQSNNSDVSALNSTRLKKTRRGGMREARVEVTSSHRVP